MALIACDKQSTQQSPSSNSTVTPVAESKTKTYDGPLGISKGIPVEEVEKKFGFKSFAPGTFIFTGKTPKLIDGASGYFIVATPNQGVCKVVVQFRVENLNGEGTQLKEKVDQMKDLIALKYGEYTEKFDFVTEDVYRRNPSFWTMALLKDSATYSYGWQSDKREKGLPNNLKSIDISASANSISKGTVDIQYEFDNFPLCQKEMKEAKAANL